MSTYSFIKLQVYNKVGWHIHNMGELNNYPLFRCLDFVQGIFIGIFQCFSESITKFINFEYQNYNMQLNKSSVFQQDSLFPQHMAIEDPNSPQNSCPPHKTSPSPQPHDDQSLSHLNYQLEMVSIGSRQLNFYQEFKKIYTVSHHLALEKMRQVATIHTLNKRIQSIEDKMRDLREKDIQKDQIQEENRCKRSRRPAEQIEKLFKCAVQFCGRDYGSEGSLQQHIKLKHPHLYQNARSEDSVDHELRDHLL